MTTAAAALHERSIVVDTHNDLLMSCARRKPADQGAYFRAHWLPQLRDGGVKIQVLPVFIDDDFRPEGALRQTLRMLETGWQIAASNPDAVRVCLTRADIDAALEGGLIALILALEGCEAVGTDVALFEPLHRLGVRIASFTHFRRTMLADGSAEDATGSRLTQAGVEAVVICEALGIMLDVSHLGATCTDHLLELATRPVIASHSSAFALRQHHRNLTDARLQAIAATGGVVGINVLGTFIDETVHTVARVVDHIEHIASLVGGRPHGSCAADGPSTIFTRFSGAHFTISSGASWDSPPHGVRRRSLATYTTQLSSVQLVSASPAATMCRGCAAVHACSRAPRTRSEGCAPDTP
jgi:membrane dipeptidase